MRKITHITDEQRAKMPEYVRKWTEIGRSTKPMDFERAAQLVMDSMDKVARNKGWTLSSPIIPRNRIVAAVSPIIAQQAGRKIAEKMGFKSDSLDGYWPAQIYGSSAARFGFLIDVMGVRARLTPDQAEAWRILEEFTQVCGGVYYGPNFAFIADRPSRLHLLDAGTSHVLHNPDGPAIAWGRDENGEYDPNHPLGTSLYYWEGLRVPADWIMDKPTTPEQVRERALEVLKDNNADRRTAGCEILGWDAVLGALDPRVIDEHPDPKFGKLVEVAFPVGNGAQTVPTRFLIAQCGTGRTIALPAMPEARTAVEAGAMSYDIPVEEYEGLGYRS